MLKIEVNSNNENNSFKSKVDAKNTHTLEAMYIMAVAYDLIRENDTSGIKEKEIFKDVKNMAKELQKQNNERKK